MAKFIISNSKIEIEKNRELNQNFSSNYLAADSVYGVTYEKICYSFGNSIIGENGEPSIFGVGTYIYSGLTGKSALKKILNDWPLKNIEAYKRDIFGYYAIAIFESGKVTIFNDYYGIYDVCYCSNEEGDFFIGNSLSDVAIASKETAISEYDYIMESCQSGTFPGKTIYQKINKLLGNEYLCISSGVINRLTLESSYKITYKFIDEEKALEDLTERLKRGAQEIWSAFPAVTLFMTGGLDSRINLAAYQSGKSSHNLKGFYWTGKDFRKEDLDIAKNICASYKVPIRIENGDEIDTQMHTDWDWQEKMFKILGFSNVVLSANRRQLESIMSMTKDDGTLAFGYFCEAIRLREWAEQLHKDHFSLKNYISTYYISKNLNQTVYPSYPSYYEYVYQGHLQLLKDIDPQIDENSIPIDLFERFRWNMSRFCDSRMEFMTNNFTYGFALLSIPGIHELILSLPADVIRGGKFQMKAINMFDNKLITDFDVFSHRRLYSINSKLEKKPKIDAKNLAEMLFKVIPFIKPMVVKLYQSRHYNLNDLFSFTRKEIKTLVSNAKITFDFDYDNYSSFGIKKTRQLLFDLKKVNEIINH